MSERRFGAHRPNHGEDFLPQLCFDTRRETPPNTIQPSEYPHHDISDAGSKWNGPNPSDIGPEHTTNNWLSSQHTVTTTPLAKKPPIHIIPFHHDFADLPSGPSQEWWGEPLESSNDTSDPSHLTEENKGRTTINHVNPSQSREDESTQSTGCFAINVVTPCRENKGSISELPSGDASTVYNYVTAETSTPLLSKNYSYSYSIGHQNTTIQTKANFFNFDVTKQNSSRHSHGGMKITIMISTIHGCYICGRAIQTIELLRRCFYPRRDVIKWAHKLETGASCLWKRVSVNRIKTIVPELLIKLCCH